MYVLCDISLIYGRTHDEHVSSCLSRLYYRLLIYSAVDLEEALRARVAVDGCAVALLCAARAQVEAPQRKPDAAGLSLRIVLSGEEPVGYLALLRLVLPADRRAENLPP